jgi:hypothetical protein
MVKLFFSKNVCVSRISMLVEKILINRHLHADKDREKQTNKKQFFSS